MNALTESPPPTGLTSEKFPLLVFFDGQCAFCNQWVTRLRLADHAHRIRFGAKQGHTFQGVAQAHPDLADVESVVVVERRADGGEDFFVRSAAVREVVKDLPQFRFFAVVLRLFPTVISDIGYRIFSKLRIPLFGRLDACHVPTKEEREFYVD